MPTMFLLDQANLIIDVTLAGLAPRAEASEADAISYLTGLRL